MNTKFCRAYLSLMYAFLYIPILVIIAFSFNDASRSLIWHGLTTHWYHVLIQDQDLIHIAGNSLTVAILSSTCATLLGALASVTLYRYRFFGKTALHSLLFVLVIVPDIVVGIALLLLYHALHIPLGFWSLLIAHITFSLPFVFLTAFARLNGLNRHLIEAARDLGAKEHTIFFRIFMPLLKPALIAGWLLCFTLSLDDVIISYFVTGPTFEILPLRIYAMVHLGVSPEINALCTLLFGLTLILVLLSHFFLRKKA
ncbi:MAG: spermidine/putrescine ABC transporter permease PotC [Gammaproteobacteria bacterium RIFCSPHIGHO2_12_FULL_45_9]|nr:MAG: spermidine/putrescine ABC transporter permease PotC [Gammaproteobacteria bacterium RIFCSPHIGHO2_12_FULL_45_9]